MNLSPEEIRQHGLEELDTLRWRVQLWRDDYIQAAPAGGGEEWLFLSRDFVGEIEDYLYPYIRRMVETDHIDQAQASEFLDFCYRQVLEFIEHLGIETSLPGNQGTLIRDASDLQVTTGG
jgi:hypothetical protein